MELEKYPCDIIVPLGGVALQIFLPNEKISDVGGKPIKVDGGTIFPVLHPSAPVHVPRKRGEFESQMKALGAFINNENLNVRKPDYATVDNCPYEFAQLEPTVFAFDFETTGLNPSRDNLRCVSFSDVVGTSLCIKDVKTIPLPFWHHHGFIAHNAKFEWHFCREKVGFEPDIIGDTKMAHLLLHEEENNHLDLLSQIYTTLGGFKDESEKWLRANNNDWRNMPIEILMRRNCGDSDATLRIHIILEKELEEQGLTWLYNNISVPSQWVASRIEHRGMYVNTNILDKVKNEEMEKSNNIKSNICSQYNLDDINFRSPKQIKHLIFELMGMPVVRKNKKSGEPSTDEEALETMISKLNKGDPKKDHLKWIIDCRSSLYNTSKIDELIKWRRPDGTVSSELNYAVTGRYRSKNPNMQNLPTDGLIKKAFESRWEGGKIVEADYSQLELRLIASESRCRDLIAAYKDKRDIHQETAEMFGLDRSDAKRVNFAVAYGVGPSTLARNLKRDYMEAKDFIRDKSKQWWEIGLWRNRQIDFCKENGYVVNKFGRRRRLPDINSPNEHLVIDASLQAGNFPIQSLGVDTLNYSMVLIEKAMHPRNLVDKKHPFKSMIINQIHDSIIVDYHPEDDLGELKKLMNDYMVNKMMKLGYYKIPLEIEIKVADTWGGNFEKGAENA